MTLTTSTLEPAELAPVAPKNAFLAGVFARLRRDPVALVSVLGLALIIGAAIFAPWISRYDPYKGSMIRRLLPVGAPGHWLGTDELGRDMAARLIYGGRLSLLLGAAPIAVAFTFGAAIGVFAGFVGGWVNALVMRVLDVFYAFPSVLLAVAVSGALGPGVMNSIIALTLVFLPQVVRVAESVTTQIRGLDYIEAARMSGAGPLTIMRRHVFGNVIAPIFVYAASLLSISMILGSGLSFLGLGVTPPEPEWGLTLSTLRGAIYKQPLVAALPGVMIFITSIAFNLLADSIRSAMDLRR